VPVTWSHEQADIIITERFRTTCYRNTIFIQWCTTAKKYLIVGQSFTL